jgi:hypothetical protein
MAQYLAARPQPQYNAAQMLLHRQQVQQQRAQQVPPGAVAQQQQSQVPPQPQPPQQQQGAPPGGLNLSPAQLQQLKNQPGMTPQQQLQLKALLQIRANNAAANAATGPPQGSVNMPVNHNIAPAMTVIAQLLQNGHPQQANNIIRQLQSANPNLNIPALVHQLQRHQQQQVQGQAMPQNLQSSQASPAQAQTAHPSAGASPLSNSAFALSPLPPNYIPNWRGRGGAAGNVQQPQQPAGPGGLGRGGR